MSVGLETGEGFCGKDSRVVFSLFPLFSIAFPLSSFCFIIVFIFLIMTDIMMTIITAELGCGRPLLSTVSHSSFFSSMATAVWSVEMTIMIMIMIFSSMETAVWALKMMMIGRIAKSYHDKLPLWCNVGI